MRVAFVPISSLCSAERDNKAKAVTELVTISLVKLYTIVEPPVWTDDKAVVKARIVDLDCTVHLVRNEGANVYGCLVDKLKCTKH